MGVTIPSPAAVDPLTTASRHHSSASDGRGLRSALNSLKGESIADADRAKRAALVTAYVVHYESTRVVRVDWSVDR